MHYVYIITSEIKTYTYVGMTQNLEDRINRHNLGHERTTKPYAPFKLVYQEKFKTRIEARKREKYFKSGIGREKIKSILAGSS